MMKTNGCLEQKAEATYYAAQHDNNVSQFRHSNGKYIALRHGFDLYQLDIFFAVLD